MKHFIIKCIALMMVLSLEAFDGISAQSLLNKLMKATEIASSALGEDSKQQEEDIKDSIKEDTLSAKDYLKSVPEFTVKKLTMLNENGDTVRYEDGSIQYHYIVYDKEGKACDPEVAKKLTNAALKSGLIILVKIGAAAAVGGAAGKKVGGKKGTLWGSLAGVAVGMALSNGDIKNVNEKTTLLKRYKAELKQYQETFTEEGLPIDVNADLSAYADCEELTQSAQEVKEQWLASQEQVEGLDSISDEELEKLSVSLDKEV